MAQHLAYEVHIEVPDEFDMHNIDGVIDSAAVSISNELWELCRTDQRWVVDVKVDGETVTAYQHDPDDADQFSNDKSEED